MECCFLSLSLCRWRPRDNLQCLLILAHVAWALDPLAIVGQGHMFALAQHNCEKVKGCG